MDSRILISRILIIDDEASIRLLLKLNLEARGFTVDEAGTAQAGLAKAAELHPHLILLDLGLPDANGLGVLKQLRQWTQVPILILTVADAERSKVELLEAGADDYVTKPFSIPELTARIKAALRHRQNDGGAESIFESGDLRIDLAKRSVTKNGSPLKLTSTEYELLRRLALNAGRVVSQEFLLTDIWGKHALDHTHYLRIYIGTYVKKSKPIRPTPSTSSPNPASATVFFKEKFYVRRF